MPTDLDAAVTARKREEQAQAQTNATVLIVCFLIFLGILVLLLNVFGM